VTIFDMLKNKMVLVVLLLLALTVAIMAFLFLNNKIDDKSSRTSEDSSKIYFGRTGDLEEGQRNKIPEGFPAEITLEFGTEIVSSKSNTDASGNLISNLEIASKSTLQENFVLYQNMLNNNGWKISIFNEDTKNGDIIDANKGNKSLNIKIYYDSIKQVRVLFNCITKK
jgi:hypothetical protein